MKLNLSVIYFIIIRDGEYILKVEGMENVILKTCQIGEYDLLYKIELRCTHFLKNRDLYYIILKRRRLSCIFIMRFSTKNKMCTNISKRLIM